MITMVVNVSSVRCTVFNRKVSNETAKRICAKFLGITNNLGMPTIVAKTDSSHSRNQLRRSIREENMDSMAFKRDEWVSEIESKMESMY